MEAGLDPSVIESLNKLGLPPNATLKEIKQAYKDLVTVWHPDRFANNPRLHDKASEKLKELNVAYNEVMAFYQKMILTERTVKFEETPQPQEPEPTPFTPPDAPRKSFNYTGVTGLLVAVLAVTAVYFVWDKNFGMEIKSNEIFNQIKMTLPRSTEPAPAAAAKTSPILDEAKTQIQQVAQTPATVEPIKIPAEKIPVPPPEPEIIQKMERKKIVQSQITDDRGRKSYPGQSAQTRDLKIKKMAARLPLTKITQTPDISGLTDDEQSSIKSTCSEAKLEGASSYNNCLKKQLTLLAQGERRPDLSRLSLEEKSSIESVCVAAKFKDGPASYNRCLKNEFATLAHHEKKPDLSRLSAEEKSSLVAVCSGAKMEGPVNYNKCLTRHLATISTEERKPDISYLAPEQKSALLSTCTVAKLEGPASYNRCLNQHFKNVLSR